MFYSCEILIDRPKEFVYTLYHDHKFIGEWYKGFKGLEPLVQNLGIAGAQAILKVEIQGQQAQMLMTYEEVVPNERLTVLFRREELWYRNVNTFIAQGNATIWRQEVTYGFTGLVKWYAHLQKNCYRYHTMSKLVDFKNFCEAQPVKNSKQMRALRPSAEMPQLHFHH